MADTVILSNNTQWHPDWSDITQLCEPVAELELITKFDFLANGSMFQKNIENACGMLMLIAIYPQLVFFPNSEFRTSLDTSVLLSRLKYIILWRSNTLLFHSFDRFVKISVLYMKAWKRILHHFPATAIVVLLKLVRTPLNVLLRGHF